MNICSRFSTRPGLTALSFAFGSKIYRQGDRVMQIKNNYRLEFKRKDGSTGKGIFNGETGIIAAVHTDDRK